MKIIKISGSSKSHKNRVLEAGRLTSEIKEINYRLKFVRNKGIMPPGEFKRRNKTVIFF
jgi:hypothetical protein